MKRLGALLMVLCFVAGAGNLLPCPERAECCERGLGLAVAPAADGCCPATEGDRRGNHDRGSTDGACACCPQARPVVASVSAPVPSPGAAVMALGLSAPPAVASPDPREILHVPKRGSNLAC